MTDEKKIDASFYDESYYQKKGYTVEKQYATFSELAGHLKQRFGPKTALDVGCSIGVLVKALRDQGIEAYGVDYSEYALAHAPKEIKSYLRRAAVDKERLPFKDGSFDMVTMLELLEHLQNHRYLIAEASRVLKKGGVVFVTTPWDLSPDEPSHINVHPRKFWIKEFESLGFEYARKDSYYFPPVLGSSKVLLKAGALGRWKLAWLRRFLERIGRTYAPLIFVKR
jgi:2-polyprenyl-3-methyl-5-hydroxy-6-metoxy-1,4-benzoquinol methylase